MVKELLAEALELSVAERIELVQDLWDSVAEIPDAISLSAEQRAELVKRLEEHRLDPSAAIRWEDIKTRFSL